MLLKAYKLLGSSGRRSILLQTSVIDHQSKQFERKFTFGKEVTPVYTRPVGISAGGNRCKSGISNEITIPVAYYEEMKDLANTPEKLAIDVREPKELKETGRIPRSINIPLAQIDRELSPNDDAKEFKQKYGLRNPQINTEMIFYCKSGKRAQKAAEAAVALGYKRVKNYAGSWTDWAEREGLSK